MSQELVRLVRTDRIAIVELHRPDALNAISGAMADDLNEAFRVVAADPDIWVMLLTAAGDRAFCVGADLKERAKFELDDYYRNREQIKGMFKALRAVPQPTIAAIFGSTFGGGFELALSCDLIVAAEDTQMGLVEARVGLLPAGGGTQLLARRIGPARPKDKIFTADRMGVDEAIEIGVVDDVAPFEGLFDEAMLFAQEICKQSPVAVREAKRAIDEGSGMLVEAAITEVEDAAWQRVIRSEDRAEGIAAFNEKREPRWRNR